jgi:hypothetical protein
MDGKWKRVIPCFLVLGLLATLWLGCGKKEEGKVVIRVGYITDYSGGAAPAFESINKCMDDLARYFNDEGLIPGVTLKIDSYDAMYNPARDIPAYEWLKEKGAEVIITPAPHTAEVLKSFAGQDKVPICTWMATPGMIDPPGWVFCAGMDTPPLAKALLKSISDHWDYVAEGRKPKIATVGHTDPSQIFLNDALTEYCQAHPDEFELVGKYTQPFGTMTWTGVVEKVKDCDYIGCQDAQASNAAFIKQLRDKGSKATLFGLDAMPSIKSLFVQVCGWEGLDGTLSFFPWGFWGDAFETTELAEELLDRYRSGEANDIISHGNGYLAVYCPYVFFSILRQAVEEVGAEDFDGQAFYDTAIKFNATYKGLPEREFTETRRDLSREAAVYEWKADVKDIVRISDWLPGLVE